MHSVTWVHIVHNVHIVSRVQWRMGARLLLVVSGAGGDWHQGFPHDGARDARTHSDDDDGGGDGDGGGGGRPSIT